MWMQSLSNYFIAKVNRHFSKEWHVTIFIVDHNHELLPLRVYDFFQPIELSLKLIKIAFSYSKKLDFNLEK